VFGQPACQGMQIYDSATCLRSRTDVKVGALGAAESSMALRWQQCWRADEGAPSISTARVGSRGAGGGGVPRNGAQLVF
jgi:hypothetical protein